jgi:hypothetical protein
MIRKCDDCGEPYTYQRRASRFCSTKCRTRNTRRPAEIDPTKFEPDDPNDPVAILQERRAAKLAGDDQALAEAMAKWDALPPSVTDPKGVRW